MGTGEEFQEHEVRQAVRRRDQGSTDQNNAIRDDIDLGKRNNRGLGDKHKREALAQKEKEKQLNQSLKISASYAKYYNTVMPDFNAAMPVVYDALEEANGKLAELESRANTFPDGTNIYKNNKGELVSEDGLIL